MSNSIIKGFFSHLNNKTIPVGNKKNPTHKIPQFRVTAFLKHKAELSKLLEFSEIEDFEYYRDKYIFEEDNALPKSYEELGITKNFQKLGTSKLINQEIDWLIYLITLYKKQIIAFITLKSVFEKDFIVGNYSKANETLTKIENKVCHSLWSFEMRLLLIETTKSTEDNKEFLSEFNKKNKECNRFTSTIAHFYSQRVEKELTVKRYENSIDNLLSRVKKQEIIEYYYFKLDKFRCKKYTKLKEILYLDSYHSIVDRYMTLSEILKIKFSKTQSETSYNFLTSRIEYLAQLTNDDYWTNLFLISNKINFKLPEDNPYLDALNNFIDGKYEISTIKFKRLLNIDPLSYEYYYYYNLANILNSGKINTFNDSNKSILEKNIYNFLNKASSLKETELNLERLQKNLLSFNVSSGLFELLNLKHISLEQYNYFTASRVPFSPDILEYPGKIKHEELKSKYRTQYPTSNYLEYQRSKLSDSDTFISTNLALSNYKKIDLGLLYQSEEKYEEAINLWKELIQSDEKSIPIIDNAINNLFFCYLKVESFGAAMQLYIDSYFQNKNLCQNIDTDIFLPKNKNRLFTKLPRTIDRAIFYNLIIPNVEKNKQDHENTVQTASELFLEALGVEKPSEVKWLEIDIEKAKICYYLINVCRKDILKHSTNIIGTKNQYIELRQVSEILLEIDVNNATLHSKNIEFWTNQLILLEGLQRLDDGKIYVDEEGLISELSESEGLFKRFQSIVKLNESRSGEIFILDIFNIKQENLDANSFNRKYSQNPILEPFIELFDAVRERFLNSESGITTYLSTRIRHGVLLSEIRPVFDNNKLICYKRANSYQDVEYWNLNNNIDVSAKLIIQENLKVLSSNIDDLIQDLNRDKIQIKQGEVNANAWFNYDFASIDMGLFAINLSKTKNYKEFVSAVIDILWQKTEKILEKIRIEIESDIKNNFDSELTKMQQNLESELSPFAFEIINTNISNCSTGVQNAIKRVSNWFKRSGTQSMDFTLETLLNVINRSTLFNGVTGKRMVLSSEIAISENIKGEYYQGFVDIFGIFINNAINHSKDEATIVPINIKAYKVDNKILIIEFKNQEVNIAKAKAIIESVSNHSYFESGKISDEKNSGIKKAFRTLRSDLKNSDNKCSFKLEEEEFYVTLEINLTNLLV